MTTLDSIDPVLLTNPTAVLATVGPTGCPQMTAVWYLVDGGEIIVSATAHRQKTKNLLREPMCSLLVFDPETPDHFVEIRGRATVTPDLDYAGADRIGWRYDADFRVFDAPGTERQLITIVPARIAVTDVR